MRRSKNYRSGDRAELLAATLLQSVAQVVQVPRQEDFGVDLQCALLVPEESTLNTQRRDTMLRVDRRFDIQVKSKGQTQRGIPSANGVRAAEAWADWIMGRGPYPIPLVAYFIGVYCLEKMELSLYTTTHLWLSRWAGQWKKVFLRTGSGNPNPGPTQSAGTTPLLRGRRYLDLSKSPSLTVWLGKPIVTLNSSDLTCGDSASERIHQQRQLDEKRRTIARWIDIAVHNQIASHLGIPACVGVDDWTSNREPVPGFAPIHGNEINPREVLVSSIGPFLWSLLENSAHQERVPDRELLQALYNLCAIIQPDKHKFKITSSDDRLESLLQHIMAESKRRLD